MEEKSKRKISKGEIAWIVVEGLFGLAGITFIVLGFVADYLPLLYSENVLLQSEQKLMKATGGFLTYRWLGFLLLLVGVIIALITLNYFAKRSDLSEEREVRRQQRLKIISESAAAEAPAPEVVDAESKPVEEKPVEETPKAE